MGEVRCEKCDAKGRRSRWKLERCGWGDEAIDRGELLRLNDQCIAEKAVFMIASANAILTPLHSVYTIIPANIFTLLHFVSTIVHIYTIIAGIARRLFSGTISSRDDRKFDL